MADQAFNSAEEEIEYWKSEAKRFEEMKTEVQEELQEFHTFSQEIEKELTMEVEQNEKQINELKHQNTTLTFEFESLQGRYEKTQQEKFRQISDLQDQLEKLKVDNKEANKYIRELEQRNDDLERDNRVLMVNLETFDARQSQALERNALLESELDEKDALAVTVQRLRDEARDLRHELAIRNKRSSDSFRQSKSDHYAISEESSEAGTATPTKSLPPPPSSTSVSNGATPTSVPPSPQTPSPTPSKPSTLKLAVTPEQSKGKTSLYNGMDRTPLTPSARISALNIVGDLLRKVGALESKLASCRSFVDQPQSTKKRNMINNNNNSSSESSSREGYSPLQQKSKIKLEMTS